MRVLSRNKIEFFIPKLMNNLNEDELIYIIECPKYISWFPELMEDYDAVSFVAGLDGSIIEYCPNFQDDYNIVLIAIMNDPRSIQYSGFLSDYNLVYLAITLDPHTIQYCNITEDIRIVWLAVGLDGLTLEYLPDYRGDRIVVTRAISNDGNAIQYSSFTEDIDMVMIAIKNNPISITHCQKFFDNIKLITQCIEAGYAVPNLPMYKEDRDVAILVLKYTRSMDYLNKDDMSLQWLSCDPWHRLEIRVTPRDIAFHW